MPAVGRLWPSVDDDDDDDDDAYLRLVQVLLMMMTIMMLMSRIIKKTLINLKIKMITREAKGRTRLIPVSQVSPQSFSKPTLFL